MTRATSTQSTIATKQMFLKLAFSLLIFSSSIQDVLSQCTGGAPRNLAFYEGTQNIPMMCNSPTMVSWTVKPTTDELGTYTITNYNNVIAPAYANLFGVDSSSLIVKTAQGDATIPTNLSTAGLYIILINGSITKFGAKLTVVRQPPACNCTAISSTKNNVTCSLTYYDSSFNPINAKMTWTSNGNFFRNDTPARTKIETYTWASTSFVTVDINDPATYQCTVTFAKPTSISVSLIYVATNAPQFSASCAPLSCSKPTTTESPATTSSKPSTESSAKSLSTAVTTTPSTTVSTSPLTTIPVTTVSAEHPVKDGLSHGAKIGIGVGISVGGMLLCGIILAVLCRICDRTVWTRSNKTADEEKDGNPYMGPDSRENSSASRNFEDRKVANASKSTESRSLQTRELPPVA